MRAAESLRQDSGIRRDGEERTAAKVADKMVITVGAERKGISGQFEGSLIFEDTKWE